MLLYYQNEDLCGSKTHPRFFEGPPPDSDPSEGTSLHTRIYSFASPEGLVVGWMMNVMFHIDQPASLVWPVFKDFNLWQNEYGHFYSRVLGDSEGGTYRIGAHQGDPGLYDYNILKVIPETLIVVSEPSPADDSTGGISRGFHVFLLNENEGRTAVTILMEHPNRTTDKSLEDAIAFWQDLAPELQRKWREVFIPALKRRVAEAARS